MPVALKLTYLKAITVVMAFLLIALSNVNAADATAGKAAEDVQSEQPSKHIYFSLADELGFPIPEGRDAFDCTDKIYTVVELENFPMGRHELSILWIDPAETSREHTKYAFHVRQKETRLWAWLRLSRATGAGMLQWLNPAAGLEEFIGPWTVEIRIDNKKIATEKFQVSC